MSFPTLYFLLILLPKMNCYLFLFGGGQLKLATLSSSWKLLPVAIVLPLFALWGLWFMFHSGMPLVLDGAFFSLVVVESQECLCSQLFFI